MKESLPKAKLKRIPSAAQRANVAEFDELVDSLGLNEAEQRPRRWTMRIGALLQRVRTHAQLKQTQMSKKAGLTQSYLSRLENGLIPKRGPTIDVLLRWAEAADSTIEVVVRSKREGRILGMVSSQDLDDVPDATDLPDAPLKDEVKVVFSTEAKARPRNSQGEASRTAAINPLAALEQVQKSLARLLETHGTDDSLAIGMADEQGHGPLGQVMGDMARALKATLPGRLEGGKVLLGRPRFPNKVVEVTGKDFVILQEGAAVIVSPDQDSVEVSAVDLLEQKA
jgi:transcriptional regulator with XRE-family HTH domain